MDQSTQTQIPITANVQGAITLREYIDLSARMQSEALKTAEGRFQLLFESHKNAHDSEREMIKTAVTKAEEALTIRLEQMNQFREQINAERNGYLTKAEWLRIEEGIVRRLTKNEEAQQSQENMWSNLQGKTTMIGGFIAVLSLVAVFISVWASVR